MAANFEDVALEIDVRATESLLDSAEPCCLLDCREPAECAIVCLEGAVRIPMGEIPSRVGELAGFQNQRLIVYCHHGGRSLQVAQWLRQQGFGQAQSMAGGIDAWAVEIDQKLPRY